MWLSRACQASSASSITVASALYIPGALFEFILPLVLIVKGFNEPAATAPAGAASRLNRRTAPALAGQL